MEVCLNKQGKVLIAGKAVSAIDARFRPELFQPLFLTAKDGGKAECLCQCPYLKLVIKQRAGKLHLAAWPDQAHMHHPGCAFYSSDLTEEEAAENNGVQRDVDAAVSKASYSIPWICTTGHKRKSDVVGEESARLWGILHELWSMARLNAWVPSWRRDWRFVRNALMRSADRFLVNAEPLSKHLYIPPVFDKQHRDAINAEWDEFIQPISNNPRGGTAVHSGLVLGRVAELQATTNGYLVRLQHHFAKFFVTERMMNHLSSLSRRGVQELKKPREEASGVIALMRIEAMPSGQLAIEDCVLMRVGEKLIPCNFHAEDQLLSLLLKNDREFVRPLSFEQSHNNLATFVVRDTKPKETELFVTGGGFPVQRIEAFRREQTKAAVQRGREAWFWHKPESVPDLPPPPPSPAASMQGKAHGTSFAKQLRRPDAQGG